MTGTQRTATASITVTILDATDNEVRRLRQAVQTANSNTKPGANRATIIVVPRSDPTGEPG